LLNSASSSGLERRVEVEPGDSGWLGSFDAMASPCEVHVATPVKARAREIAERVAAEVWRIERKYSRYLAGNIVHAINSARGRTIKVDPETARLLDFAATLYELSEGRFDVTSGVLRRAWRFDGSDRVPATEEVSTLLRRVGWRRAQWNRGALTLRLEPGMEIDFGGIGKEYAVDVSAALLDDVAEPCLINLGGDLVATAPPAEGRPWRVGIEAVDTSGRPARVLALSRGALATSGDARRFLLKGDHRYGHVLDARTGWPVEGGPRSVTVAAATCTQAGTYSTLALLHGAHADEFLRAQGVEYWMLH
jgi:thiamine biosynthesis lipoprotein